MRFQGILYIVFLLSPPRFSDKRIKRFSCFLIQCSVDFFHPPWSGRNGSGFMRTHIKIKFLRYLSGFYFLFELFLVPQVQATVTFSNIFSSNMILQRGASTNIYGTAGAGEPLTVTFGSQSVTGVGTSSGSWSVTLSPMLANATGQSLTEIGRASCRERV